MAASYVLENMSDTKKEYLLNNPIKRNEIVNEEISRLINDKKIVLIPAITVVEKDYSYTITNINHISELQDCDVTEFEKLISEYSSARRYIVENTYNFVSALDLEEFCNQMEVTDVDQIHKIAYLNIADFNTFSQKYYYDDSTFILNTYNEYKEQEENYEIELKAIKEGGSSSSSDELINYHELESMAPVIEHTQLFRSKNLPTNIMYIKSRGNPTKFFMDKNYVQKETMRYMPNIEKVVLLQRLQFLITNHKSLNNKELFLCTLAASRLLEIFEMMNEIELEECIVIRVNKGYLNFMYKLEDCDDTELLSAIKSQGKGIIERNVSFDGKSEITTVYMPISTAEIEDLLRDKEIRSSLLKNAEIKLINDLFEKIAIPSKKVSMHMRRLLGLSYNVL